MSDENEQDEAPTVDSSTLPPAAPRKIGHYTLQSLIGSGGMGTVYKAVQEKPRRAVALKVMKAGVTSGSALRRFEYEAQLLGRLRHPGVAQIYEAGTHDDGLGSSVPFFAMEYIPNAKSIVDYAREKNLGTRDRMALLAQVCDAVHHGHQKGIVHRDLKPANILVGPKGNPRVIDFGVARATDSDMALTAMQTDVGQLVGTVQYMSPEQCEADPEDVDTRSDVYALGVVLYELLCGALPYRLEKTPIYEATRVIRETDPGRPSDVNPKLRGDVETIVLKALEKDRDRRYQSAAELGQDLRRYLDGDAISARPASFAYHLRVFARRHKGALAAAAAILLVMIVGALVSSALYFRSESNRMLAEKQEERAEAAQEYLSEVVASLNPMELGDHVRVAELLDQYADGIEERFADQPEVEVAVREALAQSYVYLTFVQYNDLSASLRRKALGHLTRALELQRETLGSEHPDTLQSIENNAFVLGMGIDLEGAERLRRELVAVYERKHGPEHPETVSAIFSLASVLRKRGKYAEAEPLAEKVLGLREARLEPDDPDLLSIMSLVARLRQLRGDVAEAERLKRYVLDVCQQASEPDEKAIYSAKAALADTYVVQGRIDEARELFDQPYAGDDFGVESWYQEPSGRGVIDTDGTAVVVFWEAWCPYSKAFIPGVQQIHERFSDDRLQVVGLTSLSKDTSEDLARSFIEGNRLTFAVGRIDGSSFTELGFTGYPSAVVVHDGAVVFKGHPDLITQEFVEALLR